MGEARRKRLAAAATEAASTGATAAEIAIVRHVLVMDATPGPYRTEGDRMSWYLELAGGRLVAPFPATELGERHEDTARQAGLRLVRDEGTARAACEACYRDLTGETTAPDPAHGAAPGRRRPPRPALVHPRPGGVAPASGGRGRPPG